MLTACDNAVRANKDPTFIISGDSQSLLYPLAIKRIGEDVRIELKQSAPVPVISSMDATGHPLAFNFTMKGNTVMVPGKFSHLRLRHDGIKTIDIISVEK